MPCNPALEQLAVLWAALSSSPQGLTPLYSSFLLSASSVNSSLWWLGAVGNLSKPRPSHSERCSPPALPPLLLPKMSLSQGKAVQHIDSHVQIPRLSTQPGGGLGRPKKNQVLLKNNQPDSHAAQQLFWWLNSRFHSYSIVLLCSWSLS